MVVDVIMLSNTADAELYQMTKKAMESLKCADDSARFNIILVETQSDEFLEENAFSYGGIHVVHTTLPFNYNRALNEGFAYLTDAEYVVICNNDLLFGRNWFYKLRRGMEDFSLSVASPVAPGWHCHEEMVALCPSVPIFFGTRTSYEVSGWCFLIRREALDAIRPFNEKFAFEFQDVAMVKELQQAGHGKMALVRGAEVTHLLNRSHRLIGDRQGMIEGAADIYKEVYGE